MSEASKAPERIWVGFNDDDDFPRGWGTPVCGKEMFWETPEMSAPNDRNGLTEFVRADLARAAPTVTTADIHLLRRTISKESGGYWAPTDDMLRRILSALK